MLSFQRPRIFLLAVLLHTLEMLALFAFLALGQAEPATLDLKPVATARHPSVNEMSGIVQSRRYPGVFWVHNDSGDDARIFSIRANGDVVKPPYEDRFWVNIAEPGKAEWPGIKIANATNVDWEDIAIDGETLYLADMGNNGNARRDLGVYVVPEPNPEATSVVRALKFLPIRYPDQISFPPKDWFFDCEAMFTYRGKLHFITKHRKDGKVFLPDAGARLYRLDSQHTDRSNVLKKLDERADIGGWVTAADLSPNGRTLAVLCQAPVASIWFFDISRAGDRMLSAPSRRVVLRGAKQAEAIGFVDERTVLVTNEQREMFRIAVP